MSTHRIKPGKYQAVAKEHVFGRAGTGTEQVVVGFELVAEGDFKGRRVSWRGYFTDATAERTLESLESAGWDGTSLKRLDGLGSRPCVLVIEDEEGSDGKIYSKVQWVNALGGGLSVKEKLETNEIANLEERMRGIMLDRAGKRPKPQPRMREPGEDDDFGF
jgi:hypothetical protein